MRTAVLSRSDWRRAFTMVEVLAVITIIAILLAVAALAFKPSGEGARRAARGEILAMLTRARSHAISSGKPAAMVVVNLNSGPAEMRGKSMCLYEVYRDESTGEWEARDQVRRWIDLPAKTVLLDGRDAPTLGASGTNLLDVPLLLDAFVPGASSGEKEAVELSFVVFDPTGAVLHPAGSGRIEFFIGEGAYQSGRGLVVTRKLDNGSALADRVVLSRLSGRAQSVGSEVGL